MFASFLMYSIMNIINIKSNDSKESSRCMEGDKMGSWRNFLQKMHRSRHITFQFMAVLSLLTFLLISLSGCYLFPKEEEVLAPPLIEPPEITYDTTAAKKGTVEKKITGSGSFVSISQSNLFFKSRGGRLKGIYVKLGDEIKEGDIIAELDTGDLKNQIEVQKINLKKARTRYNQVKAQGGDEYSRQLAWYDVELASLQLENLERQLEEAVLRSDMAGTVVYVNNNVQEGDYVNTYQTLVRIADPRQLQLQYSGSNNSDFKLGQEVNVKIKDRVYSGEVVMTPANVPIDAPDNMKNIIRIKVEGLPEEVKMGDSAQIELVLDKRENVIVLPRSLVRNYMGRKYVLVLEDGLKKERDVEIGLETATEVEIVKGLEEGELVITR